MTATYAWLKVDGTRPAESLHELCTTLDTAEGEVGLDFSSVSRVDPRALLALADLAEKAEEQGIQISLQDVNVDVYRVLKLMKIASRFSFVAGD